MSVPIPAVLVVGAGPVGLTMAAELARHGQRCRIIDRLTARSNHCKAIGVTPRTLEVWDDMGIVREMIDAGIWLEGLRTIVPGQPPRDAILDLSDLPYGNLGIPQYQTERVLTAHLAQWGLSVERGITLESLSDDGRCVHVELAHHDGRTERAEFRYVVGCDGAHSAVRHILGIGFPGDRFPIEFMLGDVVIDWDVPRGLAVFAVRPIENAAPDFFVAIPLPEPKRYRVSTVAPAPPERVDDARGILSERPGPSLAELQTVADRLLPDMARLSDLRWSSLFGIAMRLADKYRIGNSFIAGDAAHIHPPTGGQGMNTGVQDAYNLAWKMAMVLRGAASESLLESYDAERRPIGADVVARTRADSEGLGRSRRGEDDRLRDTQILVNYRGSRWVENAGDGDDSGSVVRAGDRAPDAGGLRRWHVGYPLRLFDMLRGTEHVLVLYRTRALDACDADLGALTRLAQNGQGLLRVLAITPDHAAATDPGFPLLRDGAGAFAQAYGAKDGMIWLIRPDGYVAFFSPSFERAGLQHSLDRISAQEWFSLLEPAFLKSKQPRLRGAQTTRRRVTLQSGYSGR